MERTPHVWNFRRFYGKSFLHFFGRLPQLRLWELEWTAHFEKSVLSY